MSQIFTLRTNARHWQRFYGSNSTNEATAVEMLRETPTGSSTIGMLSTAGSNLCKVQVFGQLAANSAKQIYTYLHGYARGQSNAFGASGKGVWIPSFICKLKWTWTGDHTSNIVHGHDAGAFGGVTYANAAEHTATDVFADKVELIDGDTSIRLITDTNLHAASVSVDLEGASYLAITFDDGGTLSKPTNWNALGGLF